MLYSLDTVGRKIDKDLEGSGLGLIEVISRPFPGATEVNEGKPQSE
jgi:hypothetical protein